MKRLLLAIFLFSAYLGSSAQCDPNPLYADSVFGVWPDTATNFPPAILNQSYFAQMDLKLPTNSSQVPDLGIAISIPIDSGKVDNVLGLPPGVIYQCNSHTGAVCSFLSGDQGCAVLTGVPTAAGTYDLVIQITAYLNLAGSPLDSQLDFEGYRVVVAEDGTTSIEEPSELKPSLGQNSPNPFQTRTVIPYTLSSSQIVEFSVMDLLGQEVYSRKLRGQRGENTIEFIPEGLESGIYMYAIRTDHGTVTRRMVYDRP